MDAHQFAPQFARPPFGADITSLSEFDYRNSERPRTSYGRDDIVDTPMLRKHFCRQFWSTGRCSYGNDCIFTHTRNQSRENVNPSVWQRSAGDGNMCRYPRATNEINSRRVVCKSLFRGRCTPYDRCTTSVDHRLGLPVERRDNCAIPVEKVEPGVSVESRFNPYLKTRLCNKWEQGFDSCPYGENCTYAHGRAELRFNPYGNVSAASRSYRKIVSPIADEQTAPADQKVPPKVCLFKWNYRKKIAGIYADWIEEDPIEPSSDFEQQ